MKFIATKIDTDLNEVKSIIENIITGSLKSEALKTVVTTAYETFIKEAITGNKQALKDTAVTVKDHFKSEKTALKTLNPYILTIFIELIIQHSPQVLFTSEIKTMISVMLSGAVAYRDDHKIQT